MATPFSYITYQGNGTTRDFNIPFPFLRRAHIRVGYDWDYFDDSLTPEFFEPAGFTWISDTRIQLAVPVPSNKQLTVLRNTPKSAQMAPWADGSNLQASDLNTADKQVLYVVQELLDRSRFAALAQSSTTPNYAAQAGYAQAAGEAIKADRLATPRTINGVPFNGTENITIPSLQIAPLEISIRDFTGTDTARLQAAVDAAAALNRPAVIKMEHGVTYTMTATVDVPKNYILIDLNQAIVTRSADYGSTFTFGYDITSLETYRYTFAWAGVMNGTIRAAAGTMTSGFHLSFRRVWMPYFKDLIIHDGHSGIELRSCVDARGENVYMGIVDRPGISANRFGVWIGAHSSSDYPGANHLLSKFNIWGGEPWRNPYLGASLSVGLRVTGCDGLWMEQSHIAGTKDANYQLFTQLGDFIGNTSFVDCMSDKCEGTGLSISASSGAITMVFWDGWISGGPSRTALEQTRTITKGALEGTDPLPDAGVTYIVSVKQGSTIYTKEVDYTMGTDSIVWLPGGAEPASGTAYTVNYRFVGTTFLVINNGYGVNISGPGTTKADSWSISNVTIKGYIGGHSLDALRLYSLNTANLRFSDLNIETNVAQGGIGGGILIERGSNILIDNYLVNGQYNALYGIRVNTDPPTGAGAIGIVDDVTIGTGRIRNCNYYDDTISGVPGFGVQVTGTPTNVVIDGCNARNNPTSVIERGSAFHSFPAVVRNSPGINPTTYSSAWSPGTIAADDVATLNISAPGVRLGDFIDKISYSENTTNATFLFGQCRTDTISVWLRNESTTSTTVADGTVTVEVSRKY